MKPLLEVKDMKTRFRVRKGHIYAVNGVSFEVHKEEILGIVGESGCGKSVTMLGLLDLLPPSAEMESGTILFKGNDLRKLKAREMQEIRGAEIGMIFQDPMTSLNPVVNIGIQMSETLIYHKGMNKKDAFARSGELLEIVGITDGKSRMRDYPYQLSGGMRQRVMIAMAIACEPDLIIADEPTTALDVTIQAQILELVKDLKKKLGNSIIWITHNLGVIAGIADRVAVMYAGYIVEEAKVDEIYDDPRHPYTLGLIKSVPSINDPCDRRLETIGGVPPDLTIRPDFCAFLPRCPFAFDKCRSENPLLTPVMDGGDTKHHFACWFDVRKGEPR
jgi:oligopeptide/dipeptide ABC transporter ATP-binding protein